jgi:uncharacterized protein (TIGR01777 family)
MLGRQVTGALRDRGDEVTALSRDAARARETLSVDAVGWASPKEEPAPAEGLRGRDAVVHLLGEPLAQRWSERAKREIRDSRELGTRNLVAALAALPEEERPRTLVSQSAVGFYGARGDEPVGEEEPAGSDFLARVVSAWEDEAGKAEKFGLRVVTTRTGVVLSETGGALERMLPPFRLGVGGPVAGGRQYVPWVHLDDVVGAVLFCLDNEVASGPINLSAPEPVTNRELSKALGRVLRRPAIVPVPGLAVKVLYGEMAMVVTTGQRAVPKRLMEIGYEFRRPELEPALRSTLET